MCIRDVGRGRRRNGRGTRGPRPERFAADIGPGQACVRVHAPHRLDGAVATTSRTRRGATRVNWTIFLVIARLAVCSRSRYRGHRFPATAKHRCRGAEQLPNLIINAYQAMPDGGSLRVTGSESDGFVEITMEDSGVGIDPAVAERLLEPFFTTKPTGAGLGLAIVKRFAEGHHGAVSIESGPT